MKKVSVLRIIYLTFLFILGFIVLTIYPDSGKRSSEQSKQSVNNNWPAPSFADTLKNPLVDNLKAVKKGKTLFNRYCATCHGENGEGDGPQAASLNTKPKNLTSKLIKRESDGALFWKISNGKQPMIAWKYTLSEKQRWQLVDYVRQFSKK